MSDVIEEGSAEGFSWPGEIEDVTQRRFTRASQTAMCRDQVRHFIARNFVPSASLDSMVSGLVFFATYLQWALRNEGSIIHSNVFGRIAKHAVGRVQLPNVGSMYRCRPTKMCEIVEPNPDDFIRPDWLYVIALLRRRSGREREPLLCSQEEQVLMMEEVRRRGGDMRRFGNVVFGEFRGYMMTPKTR
jgi:hypothetical protein